MLFNSINFLIFFPVIVLCYYIIPQKWRYIWLLISSYFFYMCWNIKYVLLLFFSTFVTYSSSYIINIIELKELSLVKKVKLKKLCVLISVLINLSILFVFKYFDFAISNINRILSILNLKILEPKFDIILPVGISFYIFQALSYTIDVYRNDVKIEKNFFRYALFVSFFPQLVAGPIERSKNLLYQLHENHKLDYYNIKDGLILMLWGYFQKMVIADRAAIFVNTVYENHDYKGVFLIVASILFAFQIYCDFSGYSMIAIGAAKVMGFELMENFNCPYLSQSVSEFWRRWHISLSSWFKDYLYIPLGGNRKGKFRKNINIMIVFLISGLWHGAAWTYIVWGGGNGLFQIIGIKLKPVRDYLAKILHLNRQALSHKILKVIITFFLIDFTWVFFRANGIRHALSIFKSMITYPNLWILFDNSLYQAGLDEKNFILLILAISVLILADILKYKGIVIRDILSKQEWWFRWLFYTIAITILLIFGVYGSTYDASEFIYFQF